MNGRTTNWAQSKGHGASLTGIQMGTGHEDGCYWLVEAYPADEGFPRFVQAYLQLLLLCFQRFHCGLVTKVDRVGRHSHSQPVVVHAVAVHFFGGPMASGKD